MPSCRKSGRENETDLRPITATGTTLRQNMKTFRVLALGLLVITLAFAAITLVALEASEVVVLHTALDTNPPRETRVWVVDFGGAAWIESASPERDFYRDILANPEIELSRNGRRFAYRAVPFTGPTGHELIRSLLAEKYGWADRWIGMIADTSNSIAIRLEPR